MMKKTHTVNMTQTCEDNVKCYVGPYRLAEDKHHWIVQENYEQQLKPLEEKLAQKDRELQKQLEYGRELLADKLMLDQKVTNLNIQADYHREQIQDLKN